MSVACEETCVAVADVDAAVLGWMGPRRRRGATCTTRGIGNYSTEGLVVEGKSVSESGRGVMGARQGQRCGE